jgi:hypothetical protein
MLTRGQALLITTTRRVYNALQLSDGRIAVNMPSGVIAVFASEADMLAEGSRQSISITSLDCSGVINLPQEE